MIDGLVNGLVKLCDDLGKFVRSLQSGGIHTYALMFIAGAVFLALSLL